MKNVLLRATILVVLFLIPKMVFGNVVINEVFYDPSGVDTGKEYIRLYNNSDSSVDLTNWSIDPSSANYFIIPSFTLNAKSFVNIHIGISGTNTATDLYDNGSANMGNTSGPIALFNHATTHKAETFVDYIEYGVGGQTNESEAVKTGIWATNAFIPDVAEGKTIKLKTDGVDTNSPGDWVETNPSIAQESSSESEESTTEQSETPPIPTGPNQPPVADAGDNIIGFINQEIQFDGSQSSDPENNDLHYEWNMGDGKLIELPSFTYIYSYSGTYLVTLMVFDGKNYAFDTITVKIQAGQITINEFMANPSGKDEEEEWIEIYNDSDSITDISGWQMDDTASGSSAFIFPKNTLIAPKSYLVFSRQTTKIALNNDADSVKLLMPGGILFQEINYENPPQGKSSARTAEGFVWSEPTPGIANVYNLVINPNKQTVSQINPVKPQTVKESSTDYLINLPNNEIDGGYTQLAGPGIQDAISQIKESTPTKQSLSQNSLNLVLLIVCIIFASGFIGLLLIKFRKKSLTSP